MDDAQRLARIGERAAQLVEYGSTIGLGTGSTAEAMLHALGRRVREGFAFTGVATSERTKSLASNYGISLLDLNDVASLDLCIDGADEIDPDLNLVKGRGGALLYEKLVAERADRLVIIASAEKLVPQLGTRLPLPVEVVPFGWWHTASYISHQLQLTPRLRLKDDTTPFVSDGGHYILDCEWNRGRRVSNVMDLGLASVDVNLKTITGVVDHGLFVGIADLALTVDDVGEITEHHAPERS